LPASRRPRDLGALGEMVPLERLPREVREAPGAERGLHHRNFLLAPAVARGAVPSQPDRTDPSTTEVGYDHGMLSMKFGIEARVIIHFLDDVCRLVVIAPGPPASDRAAHLLGGWHIRVANMPTWKE
jgi:hypothetical protein